MGQSRDGKVMLKRPEDRHAEAKLECGMNTATEKMDLSGKKGLGKAVYAQLLFI